DDAVFDIITDEEL
nr:Chain B, Peptide from FYVE and coiled-coil domain-containing protein 1 [Homo sapiens]